MSVKYIYAKLRAENGKLNGVTLTAASKALTRAAELETQIQPRELSSFSSDRIRQAFNAYQKSDLGLRVESYPDSESSRLARQLTSSMGPSATPFLVGFSNQEVFSGTFVCRISSSPRLAKIIASELNADMGINNPASSMSGKCSPDRLSVFIGVKPFQSSTRPPHHYPTMLYSLPDETQKRITRSLPTFRGVVTITYLESETDSPELASQIYASVKNAGIEYVGLTNDRSYREFWKWHDPDAKGIEIWHTPDESAVALAEALWSSLRPALPRVRLISTGLTLPSDFPAEPPEYRASHRVEIRIGSM